MTYAINNLYKKKPIHPKDTAYNTATYVTPDYVTEGTYLTIYNVNKEVV